MKKTLWLFLLLAQVVSGKVVSASYDVSFGVFEKLGKADMHYETRDDQTYSIRIEAYSEGISKALSNNRKEVYESYGMINNGRFVPQKYIKTRQTDSKKIVKIYTFDHAKKVVWKENIESMDWVKEENPYYAPDDLLSLFFNLQKGKGLEQNGTYYAIGGEKKDGRIDIVVPQGQSLQTVKDKLGKTDGKFLKVMINDSIFSSAKGELLIHLDSDKVCSKAILEDVLFFGDIVGTRVK